MKTLGTFLRKHACVKIITFNTCYVPVKIVTAVTCTLHWIYKSYLSDVSVIIRSSLYLKFQFALHSMMWSHVMTFMYSLLVAFDNALSLNVKSVVQPT